ncbi:MAG: hypothetical protein JXR37_08620 [Kiritimatiellae bacterium]|nr:hypothetical protein [Kiritimatiellia bacterium]
MCSVLLALILASGARAALQPRLPIEEKPAPGRPAAEQQKREPVQPVDPADGGTGAATPALVRDGVSRGVPGRPRSVPIWAWYARLGWLEARRMARVWLETREKAGPALDEEDALFYQVFADLPFFEADGLSRRILDRAAQKAELLQGTNLRNGLNITAGTAEYAYRQGIGHLALMARWFYGDPVHLERCMESAAHTAALTIRTPDGRRLFRDHRLLGAQALGSPAVPATDTGASALMWHPALQVADYNGNPQALGLVREWADSWLPQLQPDRWATELQVLSGKTVKTDKTAPLASGSGAHAAASAWLLSLTGETRYLEPFRHFYKQALTPFPADRFLGDAYVLGGLAGVPHLSVETIAKRHAVIALYALRQTEPLAEAIAGTRAAPGDGFASLRAAQQHGAGPAPLRRLANLATPFFLDAVSISYLGGFVRGHKFNSTMAVSWEGFGTDYAALVIGNEPRYLRVLLYNFSNRPLSGHARLWRLEHGQYQLEMGPDEDGNSRIDRAEVDRQLDLARGDRIALTLPPGVPTLLRLRQLGPLDSLRTRPDLAICRQELKVAGQTLSGTVHNIGSAPAPEVVVAVLDTKGKSLARKALGELAAPADLAAKRSPFALSLPGPPQKGWRLVVDPDRRVPEIYEGNNQVPLD